MVKSLITYSIAGTAVIGVFMYIVRPDVIDSQAKAIAKPVEHIIQAHEAEKYKEAKEKAYQKWMAANFRLTNDCVSPKTSLKAIECKNKKDEMAAAFENNWREKINAGWKPD